ncbi:MAG: TadE family protein [Polyangiaceae bacterium]
MSEKPAGERESETGVAASPQADLAVNVESEGGSSGATTLSATPAAKRSLRNNRDGAVMAEFAIALTPLLFAFFGFVQVSRAFQANLVLRHSAIVAARAAAVISNKNDNLPKDQNEDGETVSGKDDGKDEVELAAAMALRPWIEEGAFDDVTVEIDDQSTRDDPYGMVNVKVTATYNCGVPLGRFLVCGTGSTLTKTVTAGFPHQGAKYRADE